MSPWRDHSAADALAGNCAGRPELGRPAFRSRSGRGPGFGPKGQQGGAGAKQLKAAQGLTNFRQDYSGQVSNNAQIGGNGNNYKQFWLRTKKSKHGAIDITRRACPDRRPGRRPGPCHQRRPSCRHGVRRGIKYGYKPEDGYAPAQIQACADTSLRRYKPTQIQACAGTNLRRYKPAQWHRIQACAVASNTDTSQFAWWGQLDTGHAGSGSMAGAGSEVTRRLGCASDSNRRVRPGGDLPSHR
jgi:hypothetical protein